MCVPWFSTTALDPQPLFHNYVKPSSSELQTEAIINALFNILGYRSVSLSLLRQKVQNWGLVIILP